jgi:glutamate--cysteine ligase
VTLEPGGQLELSGAPLADVHAVRAELDAHFAELMPIAHDLGLIWLGIGFQPFARQAELPWVPKQRYGIMREYLPPRGSGALDMMRRTATVQANLDFSSEEDALRKLEVSLRLSPLVNAMTVCSPFAEGRRAEFASVRGDVWLRMDPERSGLVRAVWHEPGRRRPGYRDYVEWALDAGMFLFKREGQVIANTGQTFRRFLQEGYRGHRATFADWKLHLQTLFPEARLKNTIEVRACDSLPKDLVCAVPALYAGLLYDTRALGEAEALSQSIGFEAVEAARPELVRTGLSARIGGQPARELAERLIDCALGGLERRKRRDAAGHDERIHLEPLARLVAQGRTPAERLLEGLPEEPAAWRVEIVRRTRL